MVGALADSLSWCMIFAGYNSVPCGMDAWTVSRVPKNTRGVWIWLNFLEAIGNSGGGIELGLEMFLQPNNFVEPR